MNYTVGTAAKATGKSKPTISRAIKNGLISAARTPDGSGYLIDAAELHRVFPPLPSSSNEPPSALRPETPNDTGVLQVEIRMLRERLEDKDKVIDDLRHRLDAEAEDRRRLTMLLTSERPSPAPAVAVEPPKRPWWQIFSR